MADLVIELILIAMILVPAILSSAQHAKTPNDNHGGELERLRRGV
jgi:hypothetical protein